MMTMYKVWKAGTEIFYYLEKESIDQALMEIRKINPDVDSCQRLTDEEAKAIKNGKDGKHDQ